MKRCLLQAAGRTDAGVHALAQTITFTTNGRIPCPNIIQLVKKLITEGYCCLKCGGNAQRVFMPVLVPAGKFINIKYW